MTVPLTAATEHCRYCRGCSYDLHALTTPRCPECGRAFDPADPRTYRRRPARRWLRRLVWGGVALVLLVLLPGGASAWVYHGWKVEQDTLRIPHYTFDVEATYPLGGTSLQAHLGRFGKYLDRASAIYGGGQEPMTPDDFEAIGRFRYLQRLELCSPQVTDSNVAYLRGLTDLTELHLYATELTDPGLLQLRTIHHLQVLDINDGAFTGMPWLSSICTTSVNSACTAHT